MAFPAGLLSNCTCSAGLNEPNALQGGQLAIGGALLAACCSIAPVRPLLRAALIRLHPVRMRLPLRPQTLSPAAACKARTHWQLQRPQRSTASGHTCWCEASGPLCPLEATCEYGSCDAQRLLIIRLHVLSCPKL